MESPEVEDPAVSHVVTGDVKGLSRSVVKAATKYDGDVAQLRDVLRGTVAVRDAEDLIRTLSELERMSGGKIWRDDRITHPLITGYSDYQVVIQMPSGVLAEILIIPKPMLRAKNGSGHKLYTPWRDLDPATPEYERLKRKQQRLYGAAKRIMDPDNRLADLLVTPS